MKTFNFNLSERTILKLSDIIKEDYIKIRNIASDSFDNLEQQFIIKTSYPDGRIFSQVLSCGSFITPYTRDPKIDIEYPIEDCPYTTIEAVIKNTQAKYTFSYETLADILNNVSEKENETKNQIKQEVDAWIVKVDLLFDSVLEWLKPLAANITGLKQKTLIREEIAGTYNISQLNINVLDKLTLHFEPVGTYILGGKGRIDIKSNFRQFDSYMLILQPVGDNEKWFLIKNRDNVSKKEFSQSQLLILIENAIKTKVNGIQN